MRLAGRLLLATLAQAIVVANADAQRAPVLRQVRTPHPYYWREMLVPQVTTGAMAAASSRTTLSKCAPSSL